MARPAGLEPATPALGKRCSIQLSYGRLREERILPGGATAYRSRVSLTGTSGEGIFSSMITQNSETQAQITPEIARNMLAEGNQRFLERKAQDRDLLKQVELTAGGQAPFAVVLSCIDSRVPAEMVFDQGIGDIFSARIAGNFVNDDLLGSMEFATKLAGSKLVLVLGHSACGAVKGACDGAELGLLTGMLGKLQPAVDAVAEPADPASRTSANGDFVQAVVEKNVELTVQAIRDRSEVMRDLEAAGEIAICGAVYDVASGKVTFCD